MGPRSISLFVLVLASTLATPVAGYDRAIMHHYTAQPPFTSDRVTKPNVLLVMDTSGSMQRPASQQVDGGQGVGIWSETFRYAGIFDPMRCYTYDAGNKRFEPSGAAKAELKTACAATIWDGNFLNWATTRRFDTQKLAMTGGTCINTETDEPGYRNQVDLTCIPSGSPAKPTITGQSDWGGSTTRGSSEGRNGVPTGSGAHRLNGRVPTAVQAGAGAEMYFHLRPEHGRGSFCTDNDGGAWKNAPDSHALTCDGWENGIEPVLL